MGTRSQLAGKSVYLMKNKLLAALFVGNSSKTVKWNKKCKDTYDRPILKLLKVKRDL